MFKTKKVEESEKESNPRVTPPELQASPPAAGEIFVQFGLEENQGRLYKVVRSFLLPTRFGPLTQIPHGSKVRLDDKLAEEAFYGNRVEPIELGEFFTVIRPVQIVGPDGCWIMGEPGDTVKLSRDEAIKLLRQGYIKEVKET